MIEGYTATAIDSPDMLTAVVAENDSELEATAVDYPDILVANIEEL